MGRASENGAGGPGGGWWLSAPLRLSISAEVLTWAAVAVGVLLRLLDFAEMRSLYRDERSLYENLVNLPVLDFHTMLTESQLAPPVFLALERILVRLPGPDVLAARSFPLVCGIASVFLIRAAARRFVSSRAVPIAVGLFALSDWLIYYSSEMKQYSFDLALTLIALLIAAGPAPADSSRTPADPGAPDPSPWTARRRLALWIFGAIGVWCSYPLTLVLAGVGSYLFATAIIRRDRRFALLLVAIGLSWVASFGLCYVVSHRMLDQGRFIWDWWDFAFFRIPPHSWAELKFECWQLLNLFDSPSDVKTPMGPVFAAFLALALTIAGAASMLRRWPGGLYLLAAPWALTVAASAMHQYPFHGRLLIFLVPSVHLLVSQGAVAIARPGGVRATIALGAFLLLQPSLDALRHQFMVPLSHDTFDSHGDLRHDLLDYLQIEQTGTGRSKP